MDIAQPLGDECSAQGRLRLPPSERAVRTRASDCYSGAFIRRDCREYADHRVTRCRIQELNIRRLSGYWERHGSNDLSRLKHRPAVTNKEFRGDDFMLCCVHHGAKCQAGGGIVARRFGGRERAAEGTPMANGWGGGVPGGGGAGARMCPAGSASTGSRSRRTAERATSACVAPAPIVIAPPWSSIRLGTTLVISMRLAGECLPCFISRRSV